MCSNLRSNWESIDSKFQMLSRHPIHRLWSRLISATRIEREGDFVEPWALCWIFHRDSASSTCIKREKNWPRKQTGIQSNIPRNFCASEGGFCSSTISAPNRLTSVVEVPFVGVLTGVSDLLEILENLLDFRSPACFLMPALFSHLPDRWSDSCGIKATRLFWPFSPQDHDRDLMVHGVWEWNLSSRELKTERVRARANHAPGERVPQQ